MNEVISSVSTIRRNLQAVSVAGSDRAISTSGGVAMGARALLRTANNSLSSPRAAASTGAGPTAAAQTGRNIARVTDARAFGRGSEEPVVSRLAPPAADDRHVRTHLPHQRPSRLGAVPGSGKEGSGPITGTCSAGQWLSNGVLAPTGRAMGPTVTAGGRRCAARTGVVPHTALSDHRAHRGHRPHSAHSAPRGRVDRRSLRTYIDRRSVKGGQVMSGRSA